MKMRCVAAIAALMAAPLVATTGAPAAGNQGRLPQTRALPSSQTSRFHERMDVLWRGIVTGSVSVAMPAFFPQAAYVQVKAVANPVADYRDRLLAAFMADIRAAHQFLGRHARGARLLGVFVPPEWQWIDPGYCFNRIGYWHAPGSRLVYDDAGRVRSFSIFSLISWRGEWYVVHLARFDRPGTVLDPANGRGSYGPPGGC
jgi:hypothetical protein